jgi:tripartite-type tricarboxylate transporter receptor subunit TctC
MPLPVIVKSARAGLLFGVTAVVTSAWAYPTKPIRVIQPYAPGGGTEIQARAIGQHMSASWGHAVVVDARPGAGGAVGTQIAARSPADGYTLLFTNGAFVTAPALSSTPLFDPVRDFSPVVHVGTAPFILVAHRSLPATLRELVAYARSNPGKLNFGTSGSGAAGHLAMEYFLTTSGIDAVHVPFKGSTPAVASLLAGEAHIAMFSGGSIVTHIRSGKIRALGVTTRKRSDTVPEVPPISELGFKDYEALQWTGVFAPAGTPAGIVLQLNQEINRALKAREVTERFAQIDIEPAGGTSAQFAAFVQVEARKWSKVIKDGGITAD